MVEARGRGRIPSAVDPSWTLEASACGISIKPVASNQMSSIMPVQALSVEEVAVELQAVHAPFN